MVPDSTVWDDLKTITAKHGLSVPEIHSFVAFSSRHDRTNGEPSLKQQNEWAAGESPKHEWADIFSENDLTTSDGISRSYEAFRSSSFRSSHDEFLAEAIRRVPAGREAEFVSSMGITSAFGLYDLCALLKQIPDPWKGRPAVKHALSKTLKNYSRRYCMKIDRNRHYEVLPFALACQLTGLSEGDIVEVVLDAIGESPALADSQRLFSMVGLLKSRIDPDEALEALTFGLCLLDPVLEDKDGDGPWSEDLSPPASMGESIAGYVYGGLGAPSAAVRWQAAHVVLGLCALGRSEVVRHLVSLEEGDSAGPFADARLPFYRIHARQWLLIAFARAAIEFPDALAPFAGRIVEIALDNQPHVVIRMFAARTALALIEKGVLPANGFVERLARVNVSSLPAVTSKPYERVIHEAEDATGQVDEDRFYFGLDIGRYWYEPLGRVFALSQSDVEREALQIIRGELNFPARGPQQEDPRALRRIYDDRETYASHGSYPDTDDLQFYLSYHAMMIVAGRLLAQRPTHRDTEEDQDEFSAWLSWHDVSRKDGWWLADRRDPVPLEPLAWCERKKTDPKYSVITSTDFEQALFEGDRITVWGYWSTVDSTRVQSAHVWGALVSADRSMALLRALSTAKDNRAYVIPRSGGDRDIDRGGFLLKGWIEARDPESGLDEKDPWSGGVRFPPRAPAKEIIALMSLETDSDKRIWLDQMKAPVMFSQAWGQLQSGNQKHDSDHGERLQASRGFVEAMLKKLGHDLIVEVRIERRGRRGSFESREDDNERIPETTKLYVFKSSGRVITL